MSHSDVPRFIHIGTGGFGRHWCRDVLSRLVEMGTARPAAAVDVNPDHLRNAIEGYDISPSLCFTDAREAFGAVEAEFAVIVVPPARHEEMVDLALAHDMHILSEKPIADTMEACARIYCKVTAAGKKMGITMSHRFDQDKQTLQHLVSSGEVGRLNYIVCRFTHNCRKFGDWGEFRHRIPDPLLVEGSVHHFDIFRALAGSNAARVYARTWNPPWGEFAGDSTALITVEMENGVPCFYEGAKANASTMNGWTDEHFRAECELGTAVLDSRQVQVLRGGPWETPTARSVRLLDRPVWMNPWLAEQFVDWLAGGPPMETRLHDNIQCAALLFAAIESARSGQPVDVQDFLRRHLAAAAAGEG
jgi:predicted dehydrogenase